MKKQKRLLSLILALVMCLVLLPTAALAADSDFTIENGVLTKYKGPGGDVVIPDGVTTIGTGAFTEVSLSSPITKLTIPASVTVIAPYAFGPADEVVRSELMFDPSPIYFIVKEIYYGGTAAQWGRMVDADCWENNLYLNYLIPHCNEAAPTTPVEPEPTTPAANGAATGVVPLKYAEVGEFEDGFAVVNWDSGTKNQWGDPIYKYGIMDTTGKEIVPCKYDWVRNFERGLAAVELNGKWGFVDTTGREVVPCKYTCIGYDLESGDDFSDGFLKVTMDSGELWPESGLTTYDEWGLIDTTGKEVIPCRYDSLGDFSEGLVAVCMDDKWGFMDTTGKVVIPCKYLQVWNFDNGLAAVRMGDWETGKYGLIDTTGREVAPCKYDHLACTYNDDFSDGVTMVELDGKYGVIDTTGKEVVPCRYDSVGNGAYRINDFSDGFITVELNEKYGFFDTTGKEIVPCQYESAGSITEGMAAVKDENRKWGLIDATGKEVVPCKYDGVGSFNQGLAVVRLNGKYGFIDTTGKEVIPCQYNDVETFSNGLARVELRGRWGCIDTTGREVVPCKYDYVYNFSEGFARVRMGDQETVKYGFIDTAGKEVVPCKYESAGIFNEGFTEGMAAVEDENGKWGFVDTTGKEVVPCKYDWVSSFNHGFAQVDLSDKSGIIDATGKEVVPCKYKSVRILSETHALVQGEDESYGLAAITSAAPAPVDPAPAEPASTTAYASTQNVLVDGRPVEFYAYALKDEKGYDTNYVKLRDVAQVLNGSAAQFQVGWDGAISITTQAAYTPNGSEMIQNFTGNQSYTVNTSPVKVNGVETGLEAITLTDSKGGGFTYFKLRDLGSALGFQVDWSAARGICIETE